MQVGVGFHAEEPEAGCEFLGAARKSSFNEGESIAPGAGRIIIQGESFHPGQAWIEDQHPVRLADGDGLWRIAQFPTEKIGRRVPDMAGCHQRMNERLEGAGLDDLGRPRLQIRLRAEPRRDDRVGICGECPVEMRQRQEEGEEAQGQCQRGAGDGQMGTKWNH
jgi:hypothetical protein